MADVSIAGWRSGAIARRIKFVQAMDSSSEFAEEVAGPFALGYGCHFGLGQFISRGRVSKQIESRASGRHVLWQFTVFHRQKPCRVLYAPMAGRGLAPRPATDTRLPFSRNRSRTEASLTTSLFLPLSPKGGPHEYAL